MTRSIAIFNQKGGVGKTTTAMNLAAYLAFLGKKTLLIDFDPQYNATIGFGIEHDPEETIYQAILSINDVEKVKKPTSLFGLEIIPASPDLAGAMMELANEENKFHYLRNFVNKIKHQYDFIVIDMAPSLSLLSLNGLMASDEVIVPVQCEYYSVEGLEQLLDTLKLVRNNLGHPIKISGALLTMHDENQDFSKSVAEKIQREFPHYVFKSVIPRSPGLAESPRHNRPIILYDPQSKGARAYEELAKELISQNLSTEDHRKFN